MNRDLRQGHRWAIEEREYARHERRRRRRFAYERLCARRTALVAVDLVPFFVEGSAFAPAVVPRVRELADVTRAAGGTVAWVLPARAERSGEWAVEFYGVRAAEQYRLAGGSGAPAQRLWPGLETGPDDLVVEKSAPSAFFPGHCPLPGLLRARGVDTVIVCGLVTDVCVAATVRDAATLGYRAVLVADASATRSDAAHNAALATVYRSFGDVRSTAEVVRLLDGKSAGSV
ncbi:cysteine hydrolase family protein [Streptomyces sp. NPDC088762]|uniref:cysteine hydrolase family protein n=1 Tax=Streptomyces sp. NPDC088762 TaxID=3365891 RepID=UPI0037FD8592